jgi:uncharacterized protein (TIGR03067 family)
MRNIFVAVWVGVCLAGPLRAEDPPKKDSDLLQGVWEATAVESDGKAAPADEVKKFKVQVAGEHLTITTASGGATKARFKLDPATSPKAIDLTVADGEAKGTVVQGIYAVEGDQLKLCIREVPERGARPKEFKTEKNDAILYATLKRVKK